MIPNIAQIRALGGFQILYGDPAWSYNDKGSNGAADNHYETMSVEQIAALPVSQIAADDAVLFLWTTWPFLMDARVVMESWGFEYKTLAFLWVKSTTNAKEFFGLGRWTRGNTEPCLLGVRGNPPRRVDAGVRQLVWGEPEVIGAPVGQHSAKPIEVRQRIDQLMGPEPSRLELFARERAPKWHAWGNEVESTISLT